jgi:hypothetical protein
MTTQEIDIDVLKAEAKELGVPGWQACKDADKLMKKIEEAKTSGQRKTAPKFNVATQGSGSRNKQIAELEKNSLTAAEAEAKGIEIVRKANGDLMYIGEDIVCRTDKKSFEEWQKKRTESQLMSMRSIDKDLSLKRGGKRIQAVTERPKEGFDPE